MLRYNWSIVKHYIIIYYILNPFFIFASRRWKPQSQLYRTVHKIFCNHATSLDTLCTFSSSSGLLLWSGPPAGFKMRYSSSCVYTAALLQWVHASENGQEADGPTFAVKANEPVTWGFQGLASGRGPHLLTKYLQRSPPDPQPWRGWSKFWATLSVTIAPSCIHNVWWTRDAISKSSGARRVFRCEPCLLFRSYRSSWDDTSSGSLFLSFGTLTTTASLTRFELLTLRTTVGPTLETNYELFLSLIYFYSTGNQSEAVAKCV